jgi:acyl-CoA reductase-like NAD-dependent aldehyde dehydrogenase
MAIVTINPTTGDTLHSFETFSEAQIEAKLQHATDAFRRNLQGSSET